MRIHERFHVDQPMIEPAIQERYGYRNIAGTPGKLAIRKNHNRLTTFVVSLSNHERHKTFRLRYPFLQSDTHLSDL